MDFSVQPPATGTQTCRSKVKHAAATSCVTYWQLIGDSLKLYMTFDHTGWVRGGGGLTREIPGGQHGGENGSLKERRDKNKSTEDYDRIYFWFSKNDYYVNLKQINFNISFKTTKSQKQPWPQIWALETFFLCGH